MSVRASWKIVRITLTRVRVIRESGKAVIGVAFPSCYAAGPTSFAFQLTPFQVVDSAINIIIVIERCVPIGVVIFSTRLAGGALATV